MSDEKKQEFQNEKTVDHTAGVYALVRDGRVVAVPFFATEMSLHEYVNNMLDSLPFALCIDAFTKGWKKVFGQIRLIAKFDFNAGEFLECDTVDLDWSLFDKWIFYSRTWSNIRKEDLPDEQRKIDGDFGTFEAPQ